MDFIDKQKCPLAVSPPQPGAFKDFFQVGDAGENRRNLLELHVGMAGKNPRERRLSAARRAPQDHRG